MIVTAVPWYGSGMGATAEQITAQISGLATPVLTGALAASAASTAAATGAPAAILGMSPALAVPLIGAAAVGITIAVIELIKLSKGCGETCIVTSQWANQAEDLLKKNLDAYMSGPRTKSAQNTAISNFHVIWEQLRQLCAQAGTGDAGVRCITDRQEGACKWRDSAGACFNWFSGYLDPIRNDPSVVDDSIGAQASGVFQNLSSGGDLLPLALGVGLLVFAMTQL